MYCGMFYDRVHLCSIRIDSYVCVLVLMRFILFVFQGAMSQRVSWPMIPGFQKVEFSEIFHLAHTKGPGFERSRSRGRL